MAYPYTAPTVSADGEVAAIHRFLKEPTAVNRRVNELEAQKFFSDFMFPHRVEIVGAVLYEVGTGIYTKDEPEAINPGAEYPRTTLTDGASALARSQKWGEDVPITDELIGRSKRRELDRGLQQVGTTVRRKIDRVSLIAASSAVTRTVAATAVWTGDAARIWLDIQRAAAEINDQDLGMEANVAVIVPDLYPYFAEKMLPFLPRESTGTFTTGTLPAIGGLTIVPGRLDEGVEAVVLDRNVFGFLGFERIPSPEYSGDPALGIETWARRDPDANDQWLVRGRRPVVPVIDNPLAARKITGAR